MERSMTVGQLARATGVPTKTIRYYEQVGVLPVPRRSLAGYRQYGRRDVHRLVFVRRARALGLALKDLKTLTTELDYGRCGTMRPHLSNLLQSQLQTVQQRIAEFQFLQRQLQQVLHHLLTTLPADLAEGCQCLDLDAAPALEGSRHSCTSTLGDQPMDTQSLGTDLNLSPSSRFFIGDQPMDTQQTLNAFTIVPTTSGEGDGRCGCGCDCELPLIQLSLPQQSGGAQRRASKPTV